MTRALVAALALAAAAGAARAEPPIPGPFRIGGTGIMCVKEPCPRIGIMRVNGEGASGRKGWPIYSGKAPPRVTGAAGAAAAVAEHWTIESCLVVEGAYHGDGVLTVSKIVEDCRRR